MNVGGLFGRPLTVHVAALSLILVALLPFTRPGMSFTSDEGAAILQARLVARTGSWLQIDPLASIDPEQQARPVPLANEGERGRAPYAKHPAYPLLLLAAERVAGIVGFSLLGMVGTVLAALGAALLTRRIDPALDRTTFWVAGIGSPLLFYAYPAQAHSLAAAATVWGTLGVVRFLDRPHVAILAASAGAVAAAAALRSEGLLFGLALAAGVLIAAVTTRPDLLSRAVPVALVIVGAVLLVRVGETLFVRELLGPGANPQGVPSGNLLSDRASGFLYSWFTPSYKGGAGDLALFTSVVAVAAAAALVRVGRPPAAAVTALAAATAGYVVWIVSARPGPIPGLAIAAPVLWGGLWLVGRTALAGVTARVAASSAALCTLSVLAIQYRGGGSVEWGGRYFVLIVPVAAPVLVRAVAGAVARLRPNPALSVAALAMTILSVAVLAVGAVRALGSGHRSAARLLSAVERSAAAAPPGDGAATGLDSRPVVLSTEDLLPQLAWPDYDSYRWLVPGRDQLGLYAGRLRQAGVTRVVFVSPDPAAQLPQVAADYREESRAGGRHPPPFPVLVLVARQGA